jgi:hypothetical protein
LIVCRNGIRDPAGSVLMIRRALIAMYSTLGRSRCSGGKNSS